MNRETSIHDLNDHVLQKTFGHLDQYDLSDVAGVCSTFQRNAQAVFGLRYKTIDYIFQFHRTDCDCMYHRDDMYRLNSALRNFGSLINSLVICLTDTPHNRSAEVMELMNRYCGANLKEFYLMHGRFTSELILTMQSLLSQIQRLYLYECRWESPSWTDITKMFSFCSELELLWIKSARNFHEEPFDFQIRVTIPKLKSYSIEDCKGIKKKSIEKFLKMNTFLEKIQIIGCQKITNRILPSIVKHQPQLKSISFMYTPSTSDFVENAKCLRNLSALTSLQLDCNFLAISSLLNELSAARIPLEMLALSQFTSNEEFVTGFSGLKKLKKLVMIGANKMKMPEITEIILNLSELNTLTLALHALRASDLVEIIRCAPKLNDLVFYIHLTDSSTLDGNWYMKILDVVTKRTEKCRLDITLWGKNDVLNVADELLQTNQEFLQITITK